MKVIFAINYYKIAYQLFQRNQENVNFLRTQFFMGVLCKVLIHNFQLKSIFKVINFYQLFIHDLVDETLWTSTCLRIFITYLFIFFIKLIFSCYSRLSYFVSCSHLYLLYDFYIIQGKKSVHQNIHWTLCKFKIEVFFCSNIYLSSPNIKMQMLSTDLHTFNYLILVGRIL